MYSNGEPQEGKGIIKNGAEGRSLTIVHWGSSAAGGYVIPLAKVY